MRDLVAGLGYLGKGQKWVARHGRWWGFGMIPALITLVGYVVALVALSAQADDVASWATPFADHWGSPWRELLRGTLAAAVFGGGLLIALISFTAVTLLVGQPFYESLCERVDESEGGAPAKPDIPLWRELWIAARDSVYVLLRVAAFGIVLFAAGFIPLIGQTVVPVIGICVSGFFLAVELTAVGLQRRGVPQAERIRLLRRRLPLALGFGVPLILLFLVPLVTVLAMPGAVAGATLLARDLVPVEPQDERHERHEPDEQDEPQDAPQESGHPADPYAQVPHVSIPYGGTPGPSATANPYRSTP